MNTMERLLKQWKDPKNDWLVSPSKMSEELYEAMARFAHEGLPYMKGDENWFLFNPDWMINIWWCWDEKTFRATAYRKLAGEIDISHGVDLF